jgi:hypothetical protein
MKTEYAGIDYSRGTANVDVETDIHYGVISQREVLQAWVNSSAGEYIRACPHCGTELPSNDLEDLEQNDDEEYLCPSCKAILTDRDFDLDEPAAFVLNDGKYQAQQSYDDPDIFILKSPYYTFAQFCSPCAPGAGYLKNFMDKDQGGPKTYCFGHNWFDDRTAPYPVYRVSDDSLVEPLDKTPCLT